MIHSVSFRLHLRAFMMLVCTTLLPMLAPPAAHAQIDSIMVVTADAAADTAGVALGLAREFQAAGQEAEATALLQYVIEHYPGTPEAREAEELLAGHREVRSIGRGESQFIVWNTVFATWLGIAIPVAAGADEPAAYGVSLLVAPATGFFASRAYAKSRPISLGQSGAYLWSTVWASWQAVGWRSVLEIGNTETCYDYGGGVQCYSSSPELAEMKALVVGGLVGVAGGLILANQNIAAGDATLVTHASLWGTFYGLTIGGMADLSDDDLLTATLIGGNVGLLAAIPGARSWKPARGQVWVISAIGLAGGVAGLGVDLIALPDDDTTAILIPTVGATLGLVLGAALTANTKWEDEAALEPWSDSLLSFNRGAEFGFPLPRPGAVTILDDKVQRKRVPSFEVRLVQAGF